MSITLYGLKNCDTCRKALKYLQAKGADAELLDVRETPPTRQQLKDWCQKFGRDALVNKRSTTWRGLSDAQKEITSDAQAVALLREFPALMKRPVMDNGSALQLGFKPADADMLLQ